MRNKPLKYFITTALLLVLVGLYEGRWPEPLQNIIDGYNGEVSETTLNQAIILTDKRRAHILYGDGSGGGHKFGVGAPCKSEFPENWTDEKIISTTKRIAANDNLRWQQEDNGYFVTEKMEDNVRVRVVLGPKRQRVITSYPTNQPRNPCPYKPSANDNYGNR